MRPNKHWIHHLCAAICLIGGAAHAAVVFDNGPPDHVSGNNMGFAWQAEDFVLGAATQLADVHFWSLEDANAYRGSISWAIQSDAGGAPGSTVLASGITTAVTRSALGVVLGLTEYRNEFDLNSPLNLGPGRYWLVLHNGAFTNMGDPNEYLWETAAANATHAGHESFDGGATWQSNFSEHAFQLTAAVPEPASVLMLIVGLATLGCLRRCERNDVFIR